jgi:pyruvate kinase
MKKPQQIPPTSPAKQFARVKIVCTLGPATHSVEMLMKLIDAGMDVARINFSHGNSDEHAGVIKNLREAAHRTSEPIAILQDLQGPKIRIGEFGSSGVKLLPDHAFTITTENIKGNVTRVSTTYHHLPKDVRRGDRILLDDGKIELRVEKVQPRNVHCMVVTGGLLSSHKGINLPGVSVSAPSLTEKDKEDLLFGLKLDIDYVALSFVRRASDVVLLRKFIMDHSPIAKTIPVVVKIEKPEAIANIDAIIREADAVMVARGDLGVEMPTEDVPLLQKMIVRKCNEQGKPVIIATQMLETMIQNPRPTRAEASDVANAVFDGADAVMLSGETSVGKYPVQAVEVMNRIIRKTEEQANKIFRFDPDRVLSTHPYDPLMRAACMLADYVKANTIVALTHSGTTAAHVAKFRPPCCVIAVTDSGKVIHKLNLVWGIKGLLVENLKEDTDVAFKKIRGEMLSQGFIKPGDVIVTVAGIPLFEGGSTNTIKVDTV